MSCVCSLPAKNHPPVTFRRQNAKPSSLVLFASTNELFKFLPGIPGPDRCWHLNLERKYDATFTQNRLRERQLKLSVRRKALAVVSIGKNDGLPWPYNLRRLIHQVIGVIR